MHEPTRCRLIDNRPSGGEFAIPNFSPRLTQPVQPDTNPWSWRFGSASSQVGPVNINLGRSSDPELEQEVLDTGERDALTALRFQLEEIAQIKTRYRSDSKLATKAKAKAKAKPQHRYRARGCRRRCRPETRSAMQLLLCFARGYLAPAERALVKLPQAGHGVAPREAHKFGLAQHTGDR